VSLLNYSKNQEFRSEGLGKSCGHAVVQSCSRAVPAKRDFVAALLNVQIAFCEP